MTRALGVDIGATSIKIAEFDFTPKRRALLGLYEITRPSNEAAEQSDPFALVRQFFLTNQLKPERCAVGLDGVPVLVQRLRFPFSDKRRVQAAAESELSDVLPFELDRFVLDVKPLLRKTGNLHEYIAGIAPEIDVTRYNQGLEGCGLIPDGYFVDAEALGQLALHQNLPGLDAESVYAVCDLGYSSSKVAILKGTRPRVFDRRSKAPSDGDVVETRSLSRGARDLENWIRERKQLSLDETRKWLQHRAAIKAASSEGSLSDDTSDDIKQGLRPIVVELYQSFQAYRARHGQSPSKLFITGGMAGLPGLLEFLSHELRLDVQHWPSLAGFDTSLCKVTPEKERSFTVAVALAHRFAVSKPQGWLNFRRSPQAQKRVLTGLLQELAKPQLQPAFIGLGAALAFSVIYGFAGSFMLSHQREAVLRDLTAEFKRFDESLKARSLLADPARARDAFVKKRDEKEKAKLAKKPESENYRARSEFVLDAAQGVPARSLLKELQVEGLAMKGYIQYEGELAQAELDAQKQALGKHFSSRHYEIKVDRAAGRERTLEFQATWRKEGEQ